MRGFLGLELPDRVRDPLAEALEPLRKRLPPAQWVPPANWHLTLVFLGFVDAEAVDRLDTVLPPLCSGQERFDLELAGCGTFPPHRPARIAWVGLRQSAGLLALQAALADACSSAGFAVEHRDYYPHLTLVRCRRPWPRGAAEDWRCCGIVPVLDDRVIEVRSCCLFESLQGPRGVHYEVVRSYPLAEQMENG